MQLTPTLNFFHYVMNPGILGNQTYSKSMACSEPWNIQKSNGIYIPLKHIVLSSEIVPGYNYFLYTLLDHFRCLTVFWIPPSIYKCYISCKLNLGSVSGIFLDIFKHYSRAYSPILRILCILGIFKILKIPNKAYIGSKVYW